MSEFVLAKVEIEETAATIAAGREFIGPAVEAIKEARREIERQIRRDRFFLTTMEPYEPAKDASRVVRRMCDAAAAAGVGPMATVAGTIAQESLEAMVAKGLRHGWVDNGGDIALLLESPVTVEVFSAPGSQHAFGLEVEPANGIIGVCSSSGRLGHSISFGESDVTVAIAESAPLADALATAIGNEVRNEASLCSCFGRFKDVPGFIGGLVMLDGAVSMQGAVPRLVEVEHNSERITAHSRMASSRYLGGHRSAQEART